MAKSPAEVRKFLASVKTAVQDLERAEMEELRAEKAKEIGAPLEQTVLARWDVGYIQEKAGEARHAVDQQALRGVLPDRQGHRLRARGIRGAVRREIPRGEGRGLAPGRALLRRARREVRRVRPGLPPRPLSARGQVRPRGGLPDPRGRLALARRARRSRRLVTNFNRQGLDHDELETLLHEFGHVLHGVLSKTVYVSQAGTSTLQDFVEAPSQMFEEWARREQSLALFAKVCPECPRLSRDQIAQLDAARKYGRGSRYARQWIYAAFDMELSTNPRPPLEVWKALESQTPLGHVEGTLFPASFSHIASSYAAGYYGYMWSEVMALDMLSAFKDDLLDPKVGARYLATILSQGGQREPRDMVKAFLGRDPSNEAFFAEIAEGGKGEPRAMGDGPFPRDGALSWCIAAARPQPHEVPHASEWSCRHPPPLPAIGRRRRGARRHRRAGVRAGRAPLAHRPPYAEGALAPVIARRPWASTGAGTTSSTSTTSASSSWARPDVEADAARSTIVMGTVAGKAAQVGRCSTTPARCCSHDFYWQQPQGPDGGGKAARRAREGSDRRRLLGGYDELAKAEFARRGRSSQFGSVHAHGASLRG